MSAPSGGGIRVVGNCCHDTLVHAGGRTTHALGGSSSYVSAILDALRTEYSVVAKVGGDFRYAAQLSRAPVVVPEARTTAFHADFTRGERVLSLASRGPEIRPEDIRGRAKVSLACAVAGEIPPETLGRLAETSEFVLADAQGLIRGTDERGLVALRPLAETAFAPLMDRLFLLKASEEEARFIDLDRVRRQTRVVITRGADGCTVLDGARAIDVPAIPIEEVDPTGAGDCFMAGFAYGLLNGLDLASCARLANFCGAQAVSQVGVPKLRPELLRAQFDTA